MARSVSKIPALRRYLLDHPERKKDVIATLLRAGKKKLATAASRMVLAKKPHFNLSNYAENYEDDVAMLAENNYGPWKNTDDAEAKVRKAIQDLAKEKYQDVIESFGRDDIKYIVEVHMYADEADPYDIDPPDPKVGKTLEKALEKIIGKDWKKVSGVASAEKHGMVDAAGGDTKAWIVWIEGSKHNVDTLWKPLVQAMHQAGFRNAHAEPHDDATIIVYPDPG